MPVGLSEPENLLPVRGLRLAAHASGIKRNGADDVVLLELCEGANAAAVFTQNAFCAAPVVIAKKHLLQNTPRALIINSGNANAGTGKQGLLAAGKSCDAVAGRLGCRSDQVLPFSTGVIGEPLPVDKLENAIPALADSLAEDNWLVAARGIMTTDTIAKAVSSQVSVGGETITITGMAKGSGMICPNMATMLAYVATDARIDNEKLQGILHGVIEKSFNAITVDGDTSTNDACVLISTGESAIDVDPDNSEFMAALESVFTHLAQAIIRDGEGASKFVSVVVEQAGTASEAKQVAYTIAHSPLVKTALFASDPNWGRILAAVGRAGIESLDIDKVDIYLDDVCIVEQGARASSYTEEAGQRVMDQQELTIRVSMGRGGESATVWTSDLSHEYVRINAEYRT